MSPAGDASVIGPRVVCTLETMKDDIAPTTGVGLMGTRVSSRITSKNFKCTTAREKDENRTCPTNEYHFDASIAPLEERPEPAKSYSEYGGVDRASEAVGVELIPKPVR